MFIKLIQRQSLKSLRYGIGQKTQSITNMMSNFKPQTEQDCVHTVKNIYEIKEYIMQSPVQETFTNKIQYIILNKQKQITPNTLFLYRMLKLYGFAKGDFRLSLLKKVIQVLENGHQEQLSVRNVQTLLWFLYREYPLLRDSIFLELAQGYTLKLLDFQKYCLNKIHTDGWEQYLRVTILLSYLGHQIPLVKPTPQQIRQIDHNYIVVLPNLFSQQQCKQIKRKHDLHQPFFAYLCNLYMDIDQRKYDKYLHYIQSIQGKTRGQEIQRTYDTIPWNSYMQLFKMYALQEKISMFEENLAYKIQCLFWRKCETENVDFQAAIEMLQIFSKNQNCLGSYRQSIFLRLIEAIEQMNIDEVRFVPAKAIAILIRSLAQTKRFDKDHRLSIINKYLKTIPNIIYWEDGDKENMINIIESKQIQVPAKLKQFLTS